MRAMKESHKPYRGMMIDYLKTSTEVSRKDAQGVWRWMSSLRLTCTEVQLKCADKIVSWTSRRLVLL